MEISTVSETTTPALTTTGSQEMGKEQFLKMLVAQLTHQDPLNPLEDKEFIAQLAQFSGLEQMMAMNERLDQLQMSQNAMANSQIADLVGKEIVARTDSVVVPSTGEPSPLSFELSDAASTVSIRIIDESGTVVRTVNAGAMSSGRQVVAWDGKNEAGTPVAPGTYRMEIDAQDADGQVVNATANLAGVVTGVVFDNGYPELLLGTIRVRPGDVIEIRQADTGAGMQSAPNVSTTAGP